MPTEETQVPEDAILEAQEVEEKIASQSDLAKIYDALIELTKKVGENITVTKEFKEEWDLARRSGRF